MIETPALEMDDEMPCSNADQGTRSTAIAKTAAMAVAKTRDIWLGPSPASRPKTLTPTTIIPINVTSGTKATKTLRNVSFIRT